MYGSKISHLSFETTQLAHPLHRYPSCTTMGKYHSCWRIMNGVNGNTLFIPSLDISVKWTIKYLRYSQKNVLYYCVWWPHGCVTGPHKAHISMKLIQQQTWKWVSMKSDTTQCILHVQNMSMATFRIFTTWNTCLLSWDMNTWNPFLQVPFSITPVASDFSFKCQD